MPPLLALKASSLNSMAASVSAKPSLEVANNAKEVELRLTQQQPRCWRQHSKHPYDPFDMGDGMGSNDARSLYQSPPGSSSATKPRALVMIRNVMGGGRGDNNSIILLRTDGGDSSTPSPLITPSKLSLPTADSTANNDNFWRLRPLLRQCTGDVVQSLIQSLLTALLIPH